MKKFWKIGLGAVAALAIATLAWAQGIQLLTTLTGTEQVSFNYPCTVSCGATTNTIIGFGRQSAGAAGFVNTIIGGDYGTNPFQRGTSNGTAHISNTVTYGPADQWFVGGASSSIDWSQNTANAPARFGASLLMQRTAGNTDTTAISIGQVMTSGESYRFQNHTAWMEVWMLAGANYSGGAVSATLGLSSGTDQSSASFAAGTWTNQVAAAAATINGAASPTSCTPTATWTRCAFAFTVPTQVTAANVSQIGVKLTWTPSGTAGTTDGVYLAGWQLEVNDTGSPGTFDHRPPSIEFVRAAKFFQAINEPAAGINVAMGVAATTTTCQLVIPLVDQMRAAPAVSFAGTALSTSTWKIQDSAASTLATPFLAAGSGNTPAIANVTATLTTATTAGFACALQGNGGGSKIYLSAEL